MDDQQEEPAPAAIDGPPDEPRRRRQRPSRGGLRCLLGVILFGGLLLATQLSHLWSSFDVLSHFTLHLAILTAAFAIGYLMPAARVFTAVVITLIGFVGISAYAHYAGAHARVFGAAQPGERPLRVMAFNSGFQNNNVEAILAEVGRLAPDVAILIELSEAKSVILTRLEEHYPHQAECIGEPYCHLAIVSKIPISSSEFRGQWKGPPLIRATLGGGYADLSVVGVHTIRTPHIRAQFGQMRALGDYVGGLAGSYILAGDFNATPFARVLRTFEERTGLRRITKLPTWPGHFELPQLAIDHIFLSPKLRTLEDARIGERAGSDHYPVSAVIAVPAAGSPDQTKLSTMTHRPVATTGR